MSFKNYLIEKTQSINAEIQIQEYKDNFLADLSRLIFEADEKAVEWLPETIDFKAFREFCRSVDYPQAIEFEISLKSKNTKKIIEHINILDEMTENKKNDLKVNFFKSKIYEYVYKIKKKDLNSEDIDLILNNHLKEKQSVLNELTDKIKKANVFTKEKIILKPIYNFEEIDSDLIKISIKSDYDASFYCEVKNHEYNFKDLSLISENENFKEKTKKLFNFLNNKEDDKIFKIFYFEWPKKKRPLLEKNKKELSWGILVNFPEYLDLQENVPSSSEENDIWKIKLKTNSRNSVQYNNKKNRIVWMERLSDE